jgi:curved DNA-binding protein CbpA
MRLSREILELDLYAILGVGSAASVSEIRRAHRQRARASHPDLQRDTDLERTMIDINVAAWVLSDPQLRQFYDRHRHFRRAAPSAWFQRPSSGAEEWVAPEPPHRLRPFGREVENLLHRIRDWPSRAMLAVDEASLGLSTLQRTALTASCVVAALALIAYAQPRSLTKLFEDDSVGRLQR